MAHSEEPPITILVVATPDTDRKTLQFLFTPPGYELFFTNNCNQALVDGPSIQPDLILVDAEPYETKGLHSSKRLRSDPLLAKIPILLMTGQTNHDTWQKALQAGATDLIQTPCQPLALQTRANTLADSHRFHRFHRGFENRNAAPKPTLQRSPDLRVLRRVIEAISTKLDPQEILHSTCEMMSQVLPFQRINAWLLEEDDDRFELLVELSLAPTAQVAGDLFPNDGNTRPSNSFGNYMPTGRYPWLRELIRNKQMLSLSGNPAAVPQQAIRFTDHFSEPTSWVVVPLVSERRLVGFFELKDPVPQELSPSEQELAQNVANAVAESINATQLFQRLQNYAEYLDQSLAQRTRELEDERDRTQSILEALGEAVVVTDLDGSIQYANQATVELTGYDRSELLGQRMRLWRSHRQTAELYTQMLHTVEEGQNWRGEVINERKDGTLYDAALTIAPLHNGDNQQRTTGFVSVQRDITPVKEAERLKDQFISNISHELRTPLSIITLLVGNLDALFERLDEERKRKLIRDIRGHIQVLNDLISNVLEVSRLDGGRLSKEFQPVNLAAIAREETEKQGPLAKEKELTLVINGLEEVPVQGHESQLRQVIRNLVNNAIKYTPRGGTITCSCEIFKGMPKRDGEWFRGSDLPENTWAALRVLDTGIGINAEDMPHLFERFFRVRSQGNIPGAGLGLSIANELVELHGGRLSVASTPETGSQFTVYLPLEEG